MRLFTALLLLLLKIIFGCGRDTGDDPAIDPRQKLSLKTFADLPACNEVNETQLAYLQDEDNYYICQGYTWDMLIEDAPIGPTRDSEVTSIGPIQKPDPKTVLLTGDSITRAWPKDLIAPNWRIAGVNGHTTSQKVLANFPHNN